MAMGYLGDDSAMLAVVCAVGGADFGRIGYVGRSACRRLLYSGGLFGAVRLDLVARCVDGRAGGAVGYGV